MLKGPSDSIKKMSLTYVSSSNYEKKINLCIYMAQAAENCSSRPKTIANAAARCRTDKLWDDVTILSSV